MYTNTNVPVDKYSDPPRRLESDLHESTIISYSQDWVHVNFPPYHMPLPYEWLSLNSLVNRRPACHASGGRAFKGATICRKSTPY